MILYIWASHIQDLTLKLWCIMSIYSLYKMYWFYMATKLCYEMTYILSLWAKGLS
jgi:hypothetical protein